MAHVRKQPCSVPGCSARPCDPQHLMFAQPRAKGLKSGDQYTVPVCRMHHTGGSLSVHHDGDEAGWWQAKGVDPIAIARRLWASGPGPRFTGIAEPFPPHYG